MSFRACLNYIMPFCLRESSSLRQMTPWWKPNQVVSVSGCDTYDLQLLEMVDA